MSNFYEALAMGKELENKILAGIKKSFPQAFIVEGNQSDYDIFIKELNVGVEVKLDKRSQYSGNIVVEYFFRKPSAFMVTKANAWVIDIGDEVICIPVANILRCILIEQIEPTNIVGKGDDCAKWVFLIPKNIFIKYSYQSSLC